jgi:hypothetical protein
MFNFPEHKRNANQDYTKISSQSFSLHLEWLPLRTQTTTNVGKDVRKEESLSTIGGNVN